MAPSGRSSTTAWLLRFHTRIPLQSAMARQLGARGEEGRMEKCALSKRGRERPAPLLAAGGGSWEPSSPDPVGIVLTCSPG